MKSLLSIILLYSLYLSAYEIEKFKIYTRSSALVSKEKHYSLIPKTGLVVEDIGVPWFNSSVDIYYKRKFGSYREYEEVVVNKLYSKLNFDRFGVVIGRFYPNSLSPIPHIDGVNLLFKPLRDDRLEFRGAIGDTDLDSDKYNPEDISLSFEYVTNPLRSMVDYSIDDSEVTISNHSSYRGKDYFLSLLSRYDFSRELISEVGFNSNYQFNSYNSVSFNYNRFDKIYTLDSDTINTKTHYNSYQGSYSRRSDNYSIYTKLGYRDGNYRYISSQIELIIDQLFFNQDLGTSILLGSNRWYNLAQFSLFTDFSPWRSHIFRYGLDINIENNNGSNFDKQDLTLSPMISYQYRRDGIKVATQYRPAIDSTKGFNNLFTLSLIYEPLKW